MRSLLPLLPVVVLSAWITSCSSGSSTVLSRSEISVERIHQIVLANHAGVQSLSGAGRISIESPEIAQTGSFSVYVKKPDTIAVKLAGPFGIELGAAVVTRRVFEFYNSFQNQLITGSTSSDNLSKILRVQLDFDDMLNLFTGGTFLEEDQIPPTMVQEEDGYLVFTYRGTSHYRRYWIEPGDYLLSRIQHLDPAGKLVLEQRFLNYRTVDRYQMPYTMRVLMPHDRRAVSISYSDLSLNQPGTPIQLSVPRNAERIRVPE